MQSRRDFIKQSCAVCMGIVGLGAIATQLSSCAPLPVYKGMVDNGSIAVPLTSFTEKNNIVIVRSEKLDFDIAVVKTGEAYNAFLMKCTHQDNPVTATKTGFYCPSHGSAFDLAGNVTQEPALRPLKRYSTQVNTSSVLINTNS